MSTRVRSIRENGGSMISDGELASIRADLDLSLPGTAIVQTEVYASDSQGGGSVTWTAAGTVACRIAPRSALTAGDESEYADRLSAEAEWIATLPAETAVTQKDRLVIEGTAYSVAAVHARDFEMLRRVELTTET